MIHNAKDLSPHEKAVIESLLGRRLLDTETVSILALEPPVLTEERKRELTGELKKYFEQVHALRQPGTDERR